MSLSVEIRKQLGDFSLEVQFNAGDETLALLGASGCGKSVTLRCIAGILTPDEGSIVLDGVTLFDSAAHIDLPPQRRQVGYLFQQYALFPHMTVRQNIAVAVRERSRRTAATDEALRRFQLEDVASLRPFQLSGGQQQRTALARILISQPRAVLLDEPFSALDSFLQYQLESELSQMLSRFPGSVIWVSHDRGEVFRNCQHVCVMDHGHSQTVRTLSALFSSPETEAAARLSGCQNYADVQPCGSAVALPQWGVTLESGRCVPQSLRRVGIQAHHVRFASADAPNAISCTVERVIEDVFSVIALLRPEHAVSAAPPLRMEVAKSSWKPLSPGAQVTVSIAPEQILFLGDL